jgi:uncharacterized membrane protein YphA (DoxX/SURF4 family)
MHHSDGHSDGHMAFLQLMRNELQNWPFDQPPDGQPAYAFKSALAFFAVHVHIFLTGPGHFGLQTRGRPVRGA